MTARQPAHEIDPCTTLTAGEIAAVQGAPPIDVSGSVHSGGGVRVAQCFFTLSDYANSVTLEITTPSSDTPGSARAIWNRRFASREEEERERERSEKGSDEKERHAIAVEGVGDAAAWTGNRVSGGLYVLTRSAILRVGVGGSGTVDTKIARAKQLARKVIPRL